MKTLPKWMYINGITYHYHEWKVEQDSKLEGWYFCGLFEGNNGEGMPPNVECKTGWLYLCSASYLSMDDARNDLLDRINSMKYG